MKSLNVTNDMGMRTKGQPIPNELMTETKATNLLSLWIDSGQEKGLHLSEIARLAKKNGFADYNEQVSRTLQHLKSKRVVCETTLPTGRKLYEITTDFETERQLMSQLNEAKKKGAELRKTLNTLNPQTKPWRLLAMLFHPEYAFLDAVMKKSVVKTQWKPIFQTLLLGYLEVW